MTRSHPKDVAENPLTSSRAVRMALTKAANDAVGLSVVVSSVAEEVMQLDDMLGSLEDGLMLLGLMVSGRSVGMIALDMQMRAAVLEMQTTGALIAQKADDRPPTRTDKTLCDPLLLTFLDAFPHAVIGTSLEGWTDGVVLGDQIQSTRAAGLILQDRDYRVVRMRVDLDLADRQGLLVMTLPLVHHDPDPVSAQPPEVDWQTAFEQVVHDTPACLDAQLHRFPISLARAETLKIGDVLPLPGCTVHSVRLLDPDGKEVAQAKLGQIGGKRAVRLQAAPVPQLTELAAGTPSLGPIGYSPEPDPVADAMMLASEPMSALPADDADFALDAADGDMPDFMAGPDHPIFSDDEPA